MRAVKPQNRSRGGRVATQGGAKFAFLGVLVMHVLSHLIPLTARATGESGAAPLAELEILTASNFEGLAPAGKEADAILGDIVLRNGEIVAVVANPVKGRDANATLKDAGGALIDLTLRNRPNDLLGLYFVGGRFPWRDPVLETEVHEISGPVPRPGPGRGKRVSLTMTAQAARGRPAARLTWSLEGGARHISARLVLTNTSLDRLEVDLRDIVRAEGPSFDRVPPGDRRLAWFHDNWFGQAYGVMTSMERLNIRHEGQNTTIRPRGGSVTMAAGETLSIDRLIFPAGDLLALRGIVARHDGMNLRTVDIAVHDASGSPVPGAGIRLRRNGADHAAARTGHDGRVDGALPPGRYEITAFSPGHGRRDASLEVPAGRGAPPMRIALKLDSAPRFIGRARDGEGRPIPCKVIVTGVEGTPTPDFGPTVAAAEVKNVIYSADGRFSRALPAGVYDVTVAHGPEFDAVTRRVVLKPGNDDVTMDVTLRRSVDTAGWVSADFHTHTTSSGDNVTSRAGRILSLAAEGIEFAPSTEHNRLESYAPVIRELGLEAFLATSTGVELTGEPFGLNHQNAFPLVERPLTQGNGAPESAPDPVTQIRRLADWDDGSEKLVQQNHPDLGWMLFDRDGDRIPDEGFREMLRYQDAVEAWNPTILLMRPKIFHNAPGVDAGGSPTEPAAVTMENNRIFNWLQLLNQGIRIPGTANTDAHDNYLDSGGVRNYVLSSTDEPARLDPMEIVRNVERGRVIMTNGPFIEALLTPAEEGAGSEGAGPGDEVSVPHGRVRLAVRVQCPDWFDVDRVHVLVNGRPVPALSFSRYNNPYLFRGDGAVKFEETLEFDLDGDAHVIVVAAHKAPLMLPLLGPKWGELPPVGITNPIFVDVDGGGFDGNMDPLGHPLPVREDRPAGPDDLPAR